MEQSPNPNEITRAELLANAKNGDEDAFAQLLRMYSPLLDSLVSRFSAPEFSEADRQDLKQEATIAFFRALEQYESTENGVSFGYFARICMENRLVSCLRKWKHLAPVTVPYEDAEMDLVNPESDPAKVLLDRENYLALCEQIRNILSRFENEIWMRFIAGRTPEEIARELGKEKKSVENAIYRVRRKLKESLPPRA